MYVLNVLINYVNELFCCYPYSLNNENIHHAVKLWCNDNELAIKYYGFINEWNVSNVTNMNKLFYDCQFFNDDINNWNVSNVTNMEFMFSNTFSFDKNINNWNVSGVTDMKFMFYRAVSFNQNINNWNVSNVKNMTCMFGGSITFNQELNDWNVSKVQNVKNMFERAISFNQNINNWNVSNITNMICMFSYATSFKQNIFSWKVNIKCSKNEFINMLKKIPFLQSLNIPNEMFDYEHLTPLEIKKKFDNEIFNWEYRKEFIKFLINNGFHYENQNYNKEVIITKQLIKPSIRHVFDIEDITRQIAEFIY